MHANCFVPHMGAQSSKIYAYEVIKMCITWYVRQCKVGFPFVMQFIQSSILA